MIVVVVLIVENYRVRTSNRYLLHAKQFFILTRPRSFVISSSTVSVNGLPRVSGSIIESRPDRRAQKAHKVLGAHQAMTPNKSAT